MKKNGFWQLLTVTSLLLWGPTVFADVVVIVNVSNEVSFSSDSEVKRFFLGKSKKFKNGEKVQLFDLNSGNSIRDSFYQTVVGRSAAQMKSYWSRLLFTGKGNPPKELSSEDAVIAQVGRTPGGMAYVSRNKALSANVRVAYEKK